MSHVVQLQITQFIDIPSVVILTACVYYRSYVPRVTATVEVVMLAILTMPTLALLPQVVARLPRPLVDSQLATVDSAAHFNTAYFVDVVNGSALLQFVSAVAYKPVLFYLIFAAILLPPVLGYANHSRRLLLAVVVAGIATTFLFWLWPAIGPWTVEGFTPTKEQVGVTGYFNQLRTDVSLLANKENAAIVSLPSFHVILAILTAHTLNCIRYLRWLTRVLAVLICLSTITTGWHYGIDVISGVAVAVGSIAVSRNVVLTENDTWQSSASHCFSNTIGEVPTHG
jgi:hypothetical protein